MNPSTNNTQPTTDGQPVSEPVYDPSQVSIVSAGEPRYGLAPEAPQYAAEPQPQLSPPPPIPPQPPAPAVYQPTVTVPPAAPTEPMPTATPPPIAVSETPPVVSSTKTSAKAVKPKTNSNSTQNTLQIAEVRDGIVIMNDGSYRCVVMVKSINFDLMSQQEQEAVEYSYQGFLNSLYFPVQIFIRSRKVDLRPYIERLDKIRSEHDNMLLALLMEDYIEYMNALSQQTNIMDKNFYVVIPFFPIVEVQKVLTQNKNFLSGVTKLFDRSEQHVVINEADLEKAKTELRERVQSVLSGLQQCGVQGLPLDTQELIELYYDSYNPDTATRQKLKDFGNLTADIVTKGKGSAPQAHLQRELQ
jgi:hypothetical protein